MNPSLTLIPSAYSAGKLYSVLPEDGTGDFDVSRNGTATYLSSDGLLKTAAPNEPRLEFNPDGTFKGVLVEPAATNLLLRSEDFENSYWGKENISVIQTNAVSPSGQLNASLIQESNLFAVQRILSPIINYTTQNSLSLYVKYVNARFIRLSLGGITPDPILENRRADFDIVNGTVLRDTTYSSTAKINSIGNGWFRISFANQAPSVSSINRFIINFLDSSGSDNIVIQGESRQLLIWGAQLEVGSVATSYIPTEVTTVTRPADVITRTNAQDLIGQTEGSVFAFIDRNELRRCGFSIDDGSISNAIQFYVGSLSFFTYRIRKDNQQVFFTSTQNFVDLFKVIITYSSESVKFFINGIKINESVNNDYIPLVINRIQINKTIGDLIYGHLIKEFSIFKTALTDEQAIALTTL